MNKEYIQIASNLSYSQHKLERLKDMVADRWFGVDRKIKFKDYYSEIEFRDFDKTTRSELREVITDYCDKRIADIDKEIESL